MTYTRLYKSLIGAIILTGLILLLGSAISLCTPSITPEPQYIQAVLKYTVEPEPWYPLAKQEVAEVQIMEIQKYNRAVYQAEDRICFDASDITVPSNLTLEQIIPYIDKYCPCFSGLEAYLLEVDKEINLIFLFAVSRCETDGGNPEALVGEYNIFNIRNDDGSYCDYGSYRESLEHFVRLLTKSYLDEDGIYYEGVSVEDIGKHYAVPEWAPFVTSVCEDALWIINKE